MFKRVLGFLALLSYWIYIAARIRHIARGNVTEASRLGHYAILVAELVMTGTYYILPVPNTDTTVGDATKDRGLTISSSPQLPALPKHPDFRSSQAAHPSPQRQRRIKSRHPDPLLRRESGHHPGHRHCNLRIRLSPRQLSDLHFRRRELVSTRVRNSASGKTASQPLLRGSWPESKGK